MNQLNANKAILRPSIGARTSTGLYQTERHVPDLVKKSPDELKKSPKPSQRRRTSAQQESFARLRASNDPTRKCSLADRFLSLHIAGYTIYENPNTDTDTNFIKPLTPVEISSLKKQARTERYPFTEYDTSSGKNVIRYGDTGFIPIFKTLTMENDAIKETMDDGKNGRWMKINAGFNGFDDTKIQDTLKSYTNALAVIGKALNELNAYKGNKLKLTDLNIVQLYSGKEGNMQSLHADFASKENTPRLIWQHDPLCANKRTTDCKEKCIKDCSLCQKLVNPACNCYLNDGEDLDDYFYLTELYGISPLSVIYFPEGGALGVMPCSVEQSKAAFKDKNYGKIGNTAYLYFEEGDVLKRLKNNGLQSTNFKLVQLKPGDFIVFRQDLPHFGMGYLLENLRIFLYIDLKGLERQPMTTTAALLGLEFDPVVKENFKADLNTARELLSSKSIDKNQYANLTPEEAKAEKAKRETKAKADKERLALRLNTIKKEREQEAVQNVVNGKRRGEGLQSNNTGPAKQARNECMNEVNEHTKF